MNRVTITTDYLLDLSAHSRPDLFFRQRAEQEII